MDNFYQQQSIWSQVQANTFDARQLAFCKCMEFAAERLPGKRLDNGCHWHTQV